jgi:YfiH family protein
VAKRPMTKPTLENKLEVLRSANLSQISWLVHAFSTRPGGVTTCYEGRALNLGFTKEDAREQVEENRRLFLQAVGAANGRQPWPLIANRQVHSDIIHVVRAPAGSILAGDGLVTNIPGIAIAVLTADCLPVLLVDTKNRVVGAFHAGWRGTVKRIAAKGVGTMRHEFGSRPEDIYAAIGPGIQKCCYEVGGDLRSEFESQFSWAGELFHEVQQSDPVREKYPLLFLNARAPGHGDSCVRLHLDLSEANRRQLIEAGVPEAQITVSGECTACDTVKFFSHRGERGRTGRMMAVAGIAR